MNPLTELFEEVLTEDFLTTVVTGVLTNLKEGMADEESEAIPGVTVAELLEVKGFYNSPDIVSVMCSVAISRTAKYVLLEIGINPSTIPPDLILESLETLRPQIDAAVMNIINSVGDDVRPNPVQVKMLLDDSLKRQQQLVSAMLELDEIQSDAMKNPGYVQGNNTLQ